MSMRDRVILFAGFLLLLGGGGQAGSPLGGSSLTVFAAASLKETLTEIAQEWEKKTGQKVLLQCEASSTLARQIQEGAPADVFMTADPAWLDAVKPAERFDWLSNRLVCVVSKDAKDIDLKKVETLSLANEQVPAGQYAKAALVYLGTPLPARTLYGSNVRDVLSKVSQGGAQAGIVYATDAAASPNVRVSFVFPSESHPKIIYAAGLMKPAGKEFLRALRESWALKIARRRGFVEIQ